MKKLSAVWMSVLLVVLMTKNAISIEYNTNVSPELTVEIGECFYMNVRLDDVPQSLITAGFLIILDASLAAIVDVAVYDGNDLTPDIWDPGLTYKAPDAAGPGTYVLACGNLAGDGVPPNDVRIANAEICAIAEGVNTITIITIPDFDTVVSGVFPNQTVYDSQINPHVITVHQIIPPCRCEITGPTSISTSPFETITVQYDVSSNQHCTNPSEYVWSDTCIKGDVDQSGLMTIPPSDYGELCELCITDNANTNIHTGELVQCCLSIDMEGYPPDTDGDGYFDDYDNCPEIQNGFLEGTCTSGTLGENCNNNEDCGMGGYCSMGQEDADGDGLGDVCDNCSNTPTPNQEDTMPPGGNNCGDACECEGNFNPEVDDDVDGSDAVILKADFGRGGYNNPCESGNPCNGDFDCDTDVDGTDAAVFKADFGRGGYNSPCPTCTQGDWCSDYSLSSGCGSEIGSSTGERIIMSQDVERVYYLKLPDDYNPLTTYPLIFAFHGLGGDYTLWTEGYYDLQDVVGEEAILVYPNALLINNVPQWDYDTDQSFFDDLYADLEANLCFDIRKVFAVGHSNGAGMSHTLGCKRGNILRAIGPVAGSLTDYGDLIGQVAVMQIHGSNDNIFPVESIRPTRDYWIAINGCNTEEPEEGVHPTCEAYIGCDANFPVQYCEHSGGHEWPDFASSAIWGFFQNLLPVVPSDETGSGDIGNLDNGTISFQIHYPSDFVGTPYKLALALYPYDSTQPFAGSPLYFLNLDIPVGDYIFGEVTEYDNVEITLLGVEYGDYTLTVVVYIEGSSYPMPSDGIDYIGLQNFTLVSDTIEVTTPFELELVEW